MYARFDCAANLPRLSDMLLKCSAFEGALDVSSIKRTAYSDLAVRFCYLGTLHNSHEFSSSLYYRRTAGVIISCRHKALDAAYADWKARLIAMTTDGSRSMSAWISDVGTLLQQQAYFQILRIRCALNQYDLVAMRETESVTV